MERVFWVREQRHEGLNQPRPQAAELGRAGGWVVERRQEARQYTGPRSWQVCWAGKVEELVLEATGLQVLKQGNKETSIDHFEGTLWGLISRAAGRAAGRPVVPCMLKFALAHLVWAGLVPHPTPGRDVHWARACP